MAAKDLIDISTLANHREISVKGGKSRSVKKLDNSSLLGHQRAKCKKCPVSCFFKEKMIEKDPEMLCMMPVSRRRAIETKTAIVDWDDDVLKGNFSGLVDTYKKICDEEMRKAEEFQMTDASEKEKDKKMRNAIRMMNTFFSKSKDFKDMYEPTVKKLININIETNFDLMVERFNKAKEKELEGVIVVENVK